MKNFLIIFSLMFTFLNFSSARIVERIIAIVNDDIITQTDLDIYRSKLKKGGLVDDALLRLADSKKLLKDRKYLVDHLINEKIIDWEVKKQGLEITLEKVEQEIRSIAKKNRISRNQLKSALRDKGVRFSDYQEFIKTSLQRQSLIEKEVSSKIKISDDDISDYYVKKNRGSGSLVFEYTLAHILLLNKNGGPQAAKERAERVLAQLQDGNDFAVLASKFSEDPQFAQGGLLGTVKAGEMVASLENSIKDLGPGRFSGIVKTRSGFQILKVLDKTLVTNPALEQEKAGIRNKLFAQSFKKQFRIWLDDRRRESFIRVN